MRSYLLPITVLLLFTAAYLPALQSFIAKWSASEDYAHAFFTVPIAAYMIWQRRSCLTDGPGRPVVGLLAAALCMLVYLASLQLQVPTITFLATVGTVVAILVGFGGFAALRTLAIPILLLLLVIPIPNQVLSLVTAELQLFVSAVSESVIRLFQIPLFREGNILHIPEKSFQVVDACSGIRSLISMTTLSLIVGYFLLNKPWSRVILLVCAVPVALLINILRVVALVLAYRFFALDLSVGLAHTIVGLVLFCFGLALLFGCQLLLERWELRNASN